MLSFAATGICQDDELPPEWLFDSNKDIEHWGGMNQLQPLEIDDVKDAKGETRSVVITVSTGGDPYIFPDGDWGGFIADVPPFDGGEYPIIYIGVRANVTATWQIYYVTEDDGEFSERQRQNFQVAASDDFLDLEFEMETGGWQDEVVTGFRIDPGTVAGVEAEIDYLSLRGIPEGLEQAVDQTGKLSTTWGSIRRSAF